LRIRAPFRHFVADPYMGWNETSQANPTHPPRCRDQELTELIRVIVTSTPTADFELQRSSLVKS
jgi:hypothetical protein